jgi:hypothetical protein
VVQQRAFAKLQLWHMVPIAVLCHGVLLYFPIQVGTSVTQKPKTAPPAVKVATLPSPPASPKPSPTVKPSLQPVVQTSLQPVVKPPIVQPQVVQPQRTIVLPQPSPQPAQQTVAATPAQPSPPAAQPSPTPSPQPVTPTAQPSPTPSPDPFQLADAKPCQGITFCFQIPSSGNTRAVAHDLKAKLIAEYDFESIDLDGEAIIVYKLTHKTKNTIEYLHLMTTGDVTNRITHSLRRPNMITDESLLRQELQLQPSDLM